MTEADSLPRSLSRVADINPVSLAGITCAISHRLDSVLSRPVLLVCLQPRVFFCADPFSGWSFRVQDAIYAGCIPVFMSDGTHYPFADILDYSKFSVRVSPTDFDHLEHILRDIPLEKVESMQAHLISAREAFIYSSDERPEEELERKGPLWYALQSARVRLSTEYPTSKVQVAE